MSPSRFEERPFILYCDELDAFMLDAIDMLGYSVAHVDSMDSVAYGNALRVHVSKDY